jgi:hypothetical protein
MNRKLIDTQNDIEQQKNGEYAVSHNRVATVIAALVCVLLAVVVWVVIMGKGDSDYVPVQLLNTTEEYTYTVSADFLEVTGTVGALRHADSIGIRVPDNAVAGVYSLSIDDLILPEGVCPAGEIDLVLTVRAK